MSQSKVKGPENEDEMISAGPGSDDCTGMWNYVNFDKKHLFHIEILIIALILIQAVFDILHYVVFSIVTTYT